MKRFSLAMPVLALLAVPIASMADQQVFVPGTTGVGSSINSSGFFVAHDTTGLFGASAYSYDFHLDAFGPGYSDAGLVIGLDGGLTLGKLQGVSVQSTGTPLGVNLWLDTGGDGKFFTFDTFGKLTGLNGDSYASCGVPAINTASSCYMQGGAGAGGTFTLAGLQAGSVSGIGSDTPVSLWIGITNGGGQNLSADISSITVTTAGVPEPASLAFLGANFGFLGLLVVAVRRRRLHRH